MRITKRQLRRIIREEIEVLKYPDLNFTTDITLDHEYPEEVEAKEDAWAGGANIQHQLDHSKAGGAEPITQGQEILKIVERKRNIQHLRRRIREAIDNLVDA